MFKRYIEHIFGALPLCYTIYRLSVQEGIIMRTFELKSEYSPRGNQPQAISALVDGLKKGHKGQVLLGATGTGKTFTMAQVIQAVQRPALVIAPNKALAAQLCGEFKEFFPDNAVEYFVSYYDYYQPEAYIAHTDTYIEKDSSINDEIDKLRHSATSALFERRDVIIVASVSCIYGLGDPEEYSSLVLSLRQGECYDRDLVLRKLVSIQYERNDINFTRGKFRVRGDVVEIYPASTTERAIRVDFNGDEVERLLEFDALTGEILGERKHVSVFPASHYAISKARMERAIESIEAELEERLAELFAKNKLLEAQRLEQRTRYDLEMMREMGFCSGIENYSRHLTGRKPGQPPYTLLDYFPKDYLVFIDESHVSVPQIGGMYEGDRSRKQSLIEYGFRLPSAFDNRPLNFKEFEERLNQVIYVSATPGPYELKNSAKVVEQIIRPTGLVDPEISVRPTRGQIDDLLGEIRLRVRRNERVLVTTLTKKMAEDLTDYFRDLGVKVRYLHSDIKTIERMEILRDLRLGVFDVLIGINLLREGLDLPEVSLVAILDADREGYLRSERSLIQTIGRASRNAEGRVIMYADRITESMERAIRETERRRSIQIEYNEKHGITPETVRKAVRDVIEATKAAEPRALYEIGVSSVKKMGKAQLKKQIASLEKEMRESARQLAFERAAQIRDVIIELRLQLRGDKGLGPAVAESEVSG